MDRELADLVSREFEGRHDRRVGNQNRLVLRRGSVKSDPGEVLLEQPFDPFPWGQQTVRVEAQGSGKANQFKIGHAPNVGFDFCDDVLADVPAQPAASRRKHRLGEPLFLAKGLQADTDDVLGSGHLPILEVDRRDLSRSIASDSGRLMDLYMTFA